MIKYCWETGVVECVAPLEEVKQFIRDEMARVNMMYCDGLKAQKTSSNPRDDAKLANLNIAMLAGIKNAEEFDKAVDDNKICYWHILSFDNSKVIINPYKENNE